MPNTTTSVLILTPPTLHIQRRCYASLHVLDCELAAKVSQLSLEASQYLLLVRQLLQRLLSALLPTVESDVLQMNQTKMKIMYLFLPQLYGNHDTQS